MSTIIGMLINFIGINPIDALFWTAVINGVLAPPLLLLIMLISNDKKIMGKNSNGRFTNIVGWAAAVIMFGAAFGMFATWQ
jgi:Mn2+/Fe2+ NRAMP family transporter